MSEVSRWQPPWPPIQISECEWVILRDDRRRPRAMIRRFEFGEHGETWYRVVFWAPRSEDRRLLGWARSLETADMAVKFSAVQSGSLPQYSSARSAAEWDELQRRLRPP
jgi:hypothetical protein